MKIYVDWENQFVFTEKEYQQEMEKQKNLNTMDFVDFEEWVEDNFSVPELLEFLCCGTDGFNKLASKWTSFMMEKTYCEVDLADD